MNQVELYNKTQEFRKKEAARVLLECSSLISVPITSNKRDFEEVLDLVGVVTQFNVGHPCGAATDKLQTLVKKVCSYMDNTHNEPNSVKKTILKELIVICSQLYADHVLNEPKPKTLTENEE